MLHPIIKKSEELSSEELKQLHEINSLIFYQSPENHIEKHHIKKTKPTFYLYKKDDKILAFQAFNLFFKKTPFYHKEIPIIYICISYKNPKADKYIKDYAKKSNLHFIKKQLGIFWFFKPFLVSFITNNPKLLTRISKPFLTHYPNYKTSTPEEIYLFAKDYIKIQLKINGNISRNLITTEEYYGKSPITEQWTLLYESKDQGQNEFFFKEDIVKHRNNQYFVGDKGALFLGFHCFRDSVKSLFKKN